MIFSFNPFSVADDGDEDGENAFGCEAIFDKDNGQCMATSHFASPQRWCFFGGESAWPLQDFQIVNISWSLIYTYIFWIKFTYVQT